MPKPKCTLTKCFKFDETTGVQYSYAARVYKDQIVVDVPYFKTVKNIHYLKYRNEIIRHPIFVARLLTLAMVKVDKFCSDDEFWQLAGQYLGYDFSVLKD